MSKFVITIARGYGSGGKTIGKMLSKELGIPYYDRDLLRFASEESGINERLFGLPESDEFVSDDNLFNYQAKIIRMLAERESCVIVGRCADFVLRDYDYVTRVFIFASMENCIQNVVDMYGKTPKEAARIIEKTDRVRSAYYKYYTGHAWDNARNYDLCLDSGGLGYQKCVDIIKDYIAIRNR